MSHSQYEYEHINLGIVSQSVLAEAKYQRAKEHSSRTIYMTARLVVGII